MKLAKAGDDLGEVCWFKISDLLNDKDLIREVHLPIFDIFINYLLSVEEKEKITVYRILE